MLKGSEGHQQAITDSPLPALHWAGLRARDAAVSRVLCSYPVCSECSQVHTNMPAIHSY